MLADLPNADVHAHAIVATADIVSVAERLGLLGASGLDRMLLYVGLDDFDDEEYRQFLRTIPVEGLDTYSNRPDLRPDLTALRGVLERHGSTAPAIGLVAQIRAAGELELERADAALAAGAAALKIVHTPDRVDVDSAVLRSRHERALAMAQHHNVPTIIHVDLRDDLDWVRSILEGTLRTGLCIAHLGYSRRLLAPLLDEFDIVTDIANLGAHMERKPDGYRGFLDRYANQIVFGSDAFLGALDAVDRHAAALRSLELEPDKHRGIWQRSWERLFGEHNSLSPPLSVLDGVAECWR